MEVALPFNEIKFLSSLCQVSFHHISRSNNGMADALVKHGVNHIIDFNACTM